MPKNVLCYRLGTLRTSEAFMTGLLLSGRVYTPISIDMTNWYKQRGRIRYARALRFSNLSVQHKYVQYVSCKTPVSVSFDISLAFYRSIGEFEASYSRSRRVPTSLSRIIRKPSSRHPSVRRSSSSERCEEKAMYWNDLIWPPVLELSYLAYPLYKGRI